MKVVFMGTPDFAVPVLESLLKEHEVVAVYTRAPKEAGRGQRLVKSPVHLAAEKQGIEVRCPRSLKGEEEQEAFKALVADIAVVAAYGLILPKAVLEAFPKGCINVHASLLPRWRGAAPIQRAIEAGDAKSGVTIMQMAEGLDTGDMLLKGEIVIDENTTGEMLHDALAKLGGDLIAEALHNYDHLKPAPQNEAESCYATKVDKAETRLNFTLPAEVLARKIRAFSPFPGCYFEYNGERFKILAAEAVTEDSGFEAGTVLNSDGGLLIACGEGILIIDQIQRQGKKPMSSEELLRGFKFVAETVLS